MTDHVAELDEFGRSWAAAEVAGDVDVLDSMAPKDFILVGPLGFLLDKTKWLDRCRSGDFVTTALDRRDTQVRVLATARSWSAFTTRKRRIAVKPTTVSSGPPTSWYAKAPRGGWPAST